ITTNIGEMIEAVKSVSDIPCAVGFGISTPEQAKNMAKYADGVIVGSAIVKLVAKYGENSEKAVSDYVKSMKEAIK
ncbi:MAG: geranylgeranylglyceryl/heptaprenylglyceryl phosphate synthase, partial [bacterium]|nr:geranylgeranylglyceryl/heptaprenylglyceryl phosphate synthase [bacterium]